MLDTLVAEKVLGWVPDPIIDGWDGRLLTHKMLWRTPDGKETHVLHDVPAAYSTDWTEAWKIVEAMREKGFALWFHETHPGGGVYVAAFGDASAVYRHESGHSPSEAICRAALLWFSE